MTHMITMHDKSRFITADLSTTIYEAEAFSKEFGEPVDVFEEIDGDECYVCTVDAGSHPDDQPVISFPSNLAGVQFHAESLPF